MDIATRIRLQASKENGEPTLPLVGAILNEAHVRGASLRQLETACEAAISLVREYAESTPMRELQSEGKPAFESILEDLGTLLNWRQAMRQREAEERLRRILGKESDEGITAELTYPEGERGTARGGHKRPGAERADGGGTQERE